VIADHAVVEKRVKKTLTAPLIVLPLATRAAEMKPEEFKRIRKRMRLTQAELARALGVSRAAVSRWESGERSIDSVLVLALEHLAERGPVRPKGGRHAKGRK
jgi:DNA-binding transcriptional regulator YiaG